MARPHQRVSMSSESGQGPGDDLISRIPSMPQHAPAHPSTPQHARACPGTIGHQRASLSDGE